MSEAASERSPTQVALEKAAAEVSDVLLNLEHAHARAKKAHKIVSRDGVDSNAELALQEAVKGIEQVRKRLTQDTYYAGDALRLI